MVHTEKGVIMAKLSDEDKAELNLWSIRIIPWFYEDDREVWWTEVYRGEEMMEAYSIGTMEEAVKVALSLKFRKRASPLVERAIPPRHVYMTLSAKYMQHYPERVKALLPERRKDA